MHVNGWCFPVQSQQTPITELCEDPLVGPAETVEGDEQQAFLSEISEEDVEVLRQREEALLQIEPRASLLSRTRGVLKWHSPFITWSAAVLGVFFGCMWAVAHLGGVSGDSDGELEIRVLGMGELKGWHGLQIVYELHGLRDMLDVNQIMKDLASMVHEQGDTIDSIEEYIQTTASHVESANQELAKASHYQPLLNHRQCQRHLTWAKEKKNWTVAQCSKVLFSDESKFCISFGNQGPRVWRKGGEAHSPSCLMSSVKFPQSVMIWGAMSSAGVGPLCFLKTKVTAPVYQEILEHFMLPSADQLFEDADFIFQQDLAPAHTAKSTKSWLNDHGVGVLDWPANSPDLNPIENLWGIVKRKMRNKRPKNADELKATVKETWASIPPQQCHKLITSMPRQIEAVIKAKGAPTKY
ncbi:hypothetical protein QTP70_011506 [Hemibagrus guttatus]|uniref:t-SNARE coiled-coil homology domain-containing protein n=1 Tax=Hemibagrus guttatus TaxID=175788 RepID=A0AAE0RDM2_9TELE|nr:hypothetical protein QTP70_011506 [Hemibagrus guttatus]